MNTKKYIVLTLVFCLVFSIFSPNFAFAATLQPISVAPIAVISPAVSFMDEELEPKTSKTLQSNLLIPLFTKLNKRDREIISLNADLKVRGFLPSTAKTAFFGLRNTYVQKTADGRDEKMIFSLYVQDYAKTSSKDLAAMGQIEIIGDSGRRETYSFFLLAPNGDFEKSEEYKVNMETLAVEKANSWWSCVRNYLRTRCASACINALVTCPTSSWAAYLACLAVRCGGCWIRAGLCCACNCRWWCRWAVGCCRQ